MAFEQVGNSTNYPRGVNAAKEKDTNATGTIMVLLLSFHSPLGLKLFHDV